MAVHPTELLERLKGGDSEAERDLALAFAPVVEALSLAATLDPALAAPAARDALRALPSAFAGAEDARELPGLAAGAVRSAARRHSDAERRSPLLGLSAEARERLTGPVADLPGALGDVEPVEAGFMLLEVAGRLPVRYRLPFLLTWLEGLEWSATAELLDLSPTELERDLTAAHRLFERELRFALEETR